jgi:hypothetical protein
MDEIEGQTVDTAETDGRDPALSPAPRAQFGGYASSAYAGSPHVERLRGAAERLALTLVRTEQLTSESARILGMARTAQAAGGSRVVPLAEAARLSGRHPDLLRRWCATGRIDGVRVGRTWAVTRREVERLSRLPARRRHGTEESDAPEM